MECGLSLGADLDPKVSIPWLEAAFWAKTATQHLWSEAREVYSRMSSGRADDYIGQGTSIFPCLVQVLGTGCGHEKVLTTGTQN